MLSLLTSRWQLIGELPERLTAEKEERFSLPGADDLSAFSDLLGEAPAQPEADDAPQGAPFVLPALIPQDMPGEAVLSREIAFSSLSGDAAQITFDYLCGTGEVLLDNETLARFDHQALTLDLTDAMRRARTQTLTLRFSSVRPAGVCGAPMLRTASRAQIRSMTLLPDRDAQTVTLRALVHAFTPGRYVLLVTPCAPGALYPTREISFSAIQGETQSVGMTFSMPGQSFTPGTPFPAMSVKARLAALPERTAAKRNAQKNTPLPARELPGPLCDVRTQMFAYPGKTPRAFVPLSRKEALLPPQTIIGQLNGLHVDAVSLPPHAPQLLERSLIPAGIHARTADVPQESLAKSAWQLLMMTTLPAGSSLDDAALLYEAAGRPIDIDAPGVRSVLCWLRALRVRLLAEAARQGAYEGALCFEGEMSNEDVSLSLRTALSPVHLSALPLRGAWWSLSRFSAQLFAFTDGQEGLEAFAALEDEEGRVLSQRRAYCSKEGGALGLIEAQLPDCACVLTLVTQLRRGDEILEQSALPVYVGRRGPLEAAFS